jgi:hypothetical protein
MIIIITQSDINQILNKKVKQVNFKIPEYTEQQNKAWEEKFNHILNECGCSSGRQFILYSSPVYFIGLIALTSYSSLSKPLIIGLMVMAIVISGVAGKITGLLQKKQKLTALINEFIAETDK